MITGHRDGLFSDGFQADDARRGLFLPILARYLPEGSCEDFLMKIDIICHVTICLQRDGHSPMYIDVEDVVAEDMKMRTVGVVQKAAECCHWSKLSFLECCHWLLSLPPFLERFYWSLSL